MKTISRIIFFIFIFIALFLLRAEAKPLKPIKITIVHSMTNDEWEYEGKPSHFIIGKKMVPVVDWLPEVRLKAEYIEKSDE